LPLAVQPFRETAFLLEGPRLRRQLTIEQAAGNRPQRQRGIRRDYGVRGLCGRGEHRGLAGMD